MKPNHIKLVEPMDSIVRDIYAQVEDIKYTQGWIMDSFGELEQMMKELEDKFTKLITEEL